MGLSLFNDTTGLPAPDTSWGTGFITGLVQVSIFSFYFLSFLGFVVQVITGLTVVRTQFAFRASSKADIEFYSPKHQRAELDADRNLENALDDLETVSLMRDVRRIVLFSPILSIFSMAAVPASLYAHNVGDIGVRILLSVTSILLIHFANASMIHEYFNLIQAHPNTALGPLYCSAPEEKIRSKGLTRAYLTVLFVCSLINTSTDGEDIGAWVPRWRDLRIQTRSLASFRAVGLTIRDWDNENFLDTNSVISFELLRYPQ